MSLKNRILATRKLLCKLSILTVFDKYLSILYNNICRGKLVKMLVWLTSTKYEQIGVKEHENYWQISEKW